MNGDDDLHRAVAPPGQVAPLNDDATGPIQPESARSADDDELAQTLEIQADLSADGHAPGSTITSSPRPRPAKSPLIDPRATWPASEDETRPQPAVGPPGPQSPAGEHWRPPAQDPRPADASAAGDPPGGEADFDATPQSGTEAASAEDDAAETRARPRKKKTKAPWWELPVLVIIAVIVAVLIKTFLVQPFYIPSQSMEQTLHGCPGCSGDRVLVNKPIYYLRDPHPGDIVVFRAPVGWDQEPVPNPPSNPALRAVRWFGQLVGVVPPDERDLIKRVIAVGGQTVQCCDAQGRVQISATGPSGPFRSLDEPYIYRDGTDNWTPADKPGQPLRDPTDARTFGPVTIPKGRLWVMGDHRNDSADSAYHWRMSPGNVADSTVPIGRVIGKAVVIAWPPSRWRTLGTPATFTHAAALGPAVAAAPLGLGAATVTPVWLLLRRRCRRAGSR